MQSVPSYFQLARLRGLDTTWITSPLNRNCMIQLSMTANLLSRHTVLRLNKTFGRNSLRSDGVVPTLTDGCTMMCVPAAATTLTVNQLLCLTGLHPDSHSQAFDVASRSLLASNTSITSNASRCVMQPMCTSYAIEVSG